jgi:GT2 family glycosyltransferase
MKNIAYIIKTHNELPYLQLMLWSLKYNNPGVWNNINIYIFANNCNDGTKQWCDRNGLWCKEVNLPGLYSLWNHATKITNEEFLIFSASDFVLAPGFWNKIMKKNAEYRDQYFHFSGTCVDNAISYVHQDEPTRRWYVRNCGDNWQEFDYDKFLKASEEFENSDIIPKETQYCPFITTRTHYESLGGFSTGLGDYPTDLDHDFVRRGKEAGKECCIVAGAVFYHFGKKSLQRRDNIEYDWREIENL